MSQEIKLVKATKEDIPILAEFLGELFALEKDFQPNSELQAVAIETILENPKHATIYTITAGGTVIGMIVLHLSISTSEGGWAGRIEDVYIKPGFRRQGIGRQAIEELLRSAASRGLTRVTLSADKDNSTSHDFYISCGFKEMNLLSFAIHPIVR